MIILAGDIGGTHARLALYDCFSGGHPRLIRKEVYPSRQYLSLRQVVQKFMADTTVKVESACFGVAGPIVQNCVVASNLPWVVQREVLQDILKIPSVWLLNDLEAATYGINELAETALVEVVAGKEVCGNRAVLFVGTGLGEAFAIWCGGRYFPTSSEGGHSDFSPRNAFEMELFEFLARKFGHVSWERVLSGHGILNLYQFLQTKEPLAEPVWLAEEISGTNPSVAIMHAADTGESLNCQKARDLFILFLGREAGNLALKGMATGGVYLGGGIVRPLAHKLRSSLFLDEFSGKGRMSELLSNIPIKIILAGDVGLVGAARFASLSGSEKAERKAA